MDIHPVKGVFEGIFMEHPGGFLAWWCIHLTSIMLGLIVALARHAPLPARWGLPLVLLAVFTGMPAMLKTMALYRETKRMRVQLYIATGIKP
jgi:hypothetical protein